MKNKNAGLSATRIKRTRVQGYFAYSDQEITGMATASVLLLSGMMTVAFLGVILPNHPSDYIYNYWLRYLRKGPKLSRRSNEHFLRKYIKHCLSFI